jgi:hypothetical protein
MATAPTEDKSSANDSLELTRFRGHVILDTGGVRNAEIKTGVPA